MCVCVWERYLAARKRMHRSSRQTCASCTSVPPTMVSYTIHISNQSYAPLCAVVNLSADIRRQMQELQTDFRPSSQISWVNEDVMDTIRMLWCVRLMAIPGRASRTNVTWFIYGLVVRGSELKNRRDLKFVGAWKKQWAMTESFPQKCIHPFGGILPSAGSKVDERSIPQLLCDLMQCAYIMHAAPSNPKR